MNDMKRKRILSGLAALLFTLPVCAVFNEKNLSETLSVLRFELNQEVTKLSSRKKLIESRDRTQHQNMVDIMKKCNELSLMLYSQDQESTFDITYALKEVTREYKSFNKDKAPFNDIVNRLNVEIERYSRLVESLRRLPPELEEVNDLPDSLAYHNDTLSTLIPYIPAFHNEFQAVLDSSVANGRRHAFVLDEKGQADRDSCIHYATTLLLMYQDAKDNIVADNEHYEDANKRLKESYDYAKERYTSLQKKIFFTSDQSYFKILSSLPSYAKRAFEDASEKYSRKITSDIRLSHSEWRGPVVTSFMFIVFFCMGLAIFLGNCLIKLLHRNLKAFRTEDFEQRQRCFAQLVGVVIFAIAVSVVGLTVDNHFFAVATQLLLILSWLFAAILLSLLIRLDPGKLNAGLKMYVPVIFVGILVVTIRILFVPNSIINLLLPPIILTVFFWQLKICNTYSAKADRIDVLLSWVSLFVIAVATVLSWIGFVLSGLVIVIWWLFQLAAIETIYAVNVILQIYMERRLSERIVRARSNARISDTHVSNGDFFKITWLYDLLRIMVLPILTVLSVLLCISMALDVFDMREICSSIFYTPFFDLTNADGNVILNLSCYKLVIAVCLFYIFKYLSYAVRALYKEIRVESLVSDSGRTRVLMNEINLTLANNVIGILVWGIYIITCVLLLKIPMGAVSIIAAGLATGLGLAMKDILNNFIYGIQLMSGRLRVGDWLECDGIRGKCTDISYQSTQIETSEGAVMSFLNTALFNKNFKNLTRNNSYEFVKIPVGIGYGSNVGDVRRILIEALKILDVKDSYGRDIVDQTKGVTVVFDDFADSSVNIAVKQYVLVSERVAYIANAKEVIYNALNENGIEIPFPQRDVHMIN